MRPSFCGLSSVSVAYGLCGLCPLSPMVCVCGHGLCAYVLCGLCPTSLAAYGLRAAYALWPLWAHNFGGYGLRPLPASFVAYGLRPILLRSVACSLWPVRCAPVPLHTARCTLRLRGCTLFTSVAHTLSFQPLRPHTRRHA